MSPKEYLTLGNNYLINYAKQIAADIFDFFCKVVKKAYIIVPGQWFKVGSVLMICRDEYSGVWFDYIFDSVIDLFCTDDDAFIDMRKVSTTYMHCS